MTNSTNSVSQAAAGAAKALLCMLDARKTKYCPQNALWLGKAARLAYKEADEVSKTAKDWGFNNCYFFDKNETQGFVIGNQDQIVVAFRGTTCMADWMTNKHILMVKGFGGEVHRGFLAALDTVWNDVKAKITEFQDNQQCILVTGHSLGAALATLATARMLEQNMPVSGLYTFGSPRVGNETFANHFNQRFKAQTFRFVNNNDVVTRVAPRAMMYGHVGTFLYFNVMGELQHDVRIWNEFLETVKGSMEDFLKPGIDSVKDHNMETYEKYLQKNINKLLN